MNKNIASLGLGALALTLTACGGGSAAIPDPSAADYTYQNTMIASHPGMDCVMEWVNPGQYMTNCYPMSYHPPYSTRVYFPHGCTCPAVQTRPQNYSAPRPVVINKNTTVVNNTTVKNKTVTNNAPKTVVQAPKPVPLVKSK